MFRKLAAIAVAVGLAGCASGAGTRSGNAATTPAPTVATLVGRYALVAIDAHALPYAPQLKGAEKGTAWAVVSGSLALKEDGTFWFENTFDPNQAGQQNAFGFSGTCYPDGEQIRMVWDGGGSTDIMQRGDTLVVKRDGVLYAYLRR